MSWKFLQEISRFCLTPAKKQQIADLREVLQESDNILKKLLKYCSSSETIQIKCFRFSSKKYLGRNYSADSAKASEVALGNLTQHIWMKMSFDRSISPCQRLFPLHHAADLPLTRNSLGFCEKRNTGNIYIICCSSGMIICPWSG